MVMYIFIYYVLILCICAYFCILVIYDDGDDILIFFISESGIFHTSSLFIIAGILLLIDGKFSVIYSRICT